MFGWPLRNACLTSIHKRTLNKKKKRIVKTPGPSVRYSKQQVRKRSTIAIDNYFETLSIGSKTTMSGNTASNSESENEHPQDTEKGYRLRKHSYKEALNGNPPSTVKALSVDKSVPEESDIDEMGSIEDLLPPKLLLKKDEFDKKNNAGKLDSIFEAVNNLYTMYAKTNAKLKPVELAVFDTENGILPQVQGLADHAKGSVDTISTMRAEVLALREELDITKGLVHKQNKQIIALKSKQAELIARSMSENLTVTGIKNDVPKADTKILLLNFLSEHLEIELEDEEEITVVHRLGMPAKGYHRSIVFKCPASLRSRIFDNARKLAGKNFSINQQLPDSLAEQKKEIRRKIKQTQKLEENKEENEKSTFSVRGGRLYINGQMQRKKLLPPTPNELFVNKTERQRMEAIKIKLSESKPANSCRFTAAACVVDKMNDVHLAYKRLFREYPEADHIVAASIVEGEGAYQDDAEYGAGHRLLNILRDYKLGNVALFVIRHYGGENIGSLRFTVMKEAAEEALLKLG